MKKLVVKPEWPTGTFGRSIPGSGQIYLYIPMRGYEGWSIGLHSKAKILRYREVRNGSRLEAAIRLWSFVATGETS